MKTPENENERSNSQSIQNGNSVESSNAVSLAAPPYSISAGPIIQRKEHGTDGGKWEDDHEHGGKKRVPMDPSKPKQKWVPDAENGGWKQVDRGPQEKPALAPIQLPGKYKDEDKKVGWRGRTEKASNKTATVTKYFNAEEQEANMVTPNEAGNLEGSDGYLSNFGSKVYAMNKDGQLGAHDETILEANPEIEGNVRQTVHHSSIFAGDDVMHAGHISTRNGKITHLDDDSGHYRPDEKHTYAAYKKMKKQGILDENGKISLVDKGVEDKMNHAAWNSNHLTLPFAAYGQTKGNEQQMRNKVSVLDEFKAKHTVESDEDENIIPVPFSRNYVQSGGASPTYGTADLDNYDDDDFFESEDSSDGIQVMVYNPETGGFDSPGSAGSNQEGFYPDQGSQYPNQAGFYPDQGSQYPNQVSPYLQPADAPYPNHGGFYQDQESPYAQMSNSPYLQNDDSEESSYFDLAGDESEEY